MWITAERCMMKGSEMMMKLFERCERDADDPPWDQRRSPEACYRGCGAASGSWEGFWRHTPDGAYGTHPAAEASAAHYLTQSKCCMFSTTLHMYFYPHWPLQSTAKPNFLTYGLTTYNRLKDSYSYNTCEIKRWTYSNSLNLNTSSQVNLKRA